jgi:hypothetical protein
VSAEERLQRVAELSARLETVRRQVETLAESGDAEGAIEALEELNELAKQVHSELEAAKRETDAGA